MMHIARLHPTHSVSGTVMPLGCPKSMVYLTTRAGLKLRWKCRKNLEFGIIWKPCKKSIKVIQLQRRSICVLLLLCDCVLACPAGQNTFIQASTGRAQSCQLGVNTCPSGYNCIAGTTGQYLCCGSANVGSAAFTVFSTIVAPGPLFFHLPLKGGHYCWGGALLLGGPLFFQLLPEVLFQLLFSSEDTCS